MGLEICRQTTVASANAADQHHDDLLHCPFGVLDGIDQADLRDTAYEIFFMACRSSPGFSGRNALTYHHQEDGDAAGGTPKAGGVGMALTSRTKRALGLKRLRRTHVRRASLAAMPTSPRGLGGSTSSCSSGNNSPTSTGGGSGYMVPQMRSKRPMTSAEIMRQQMRVSDESDNRLRRTLMRTLAGQLGRRAETIILPLELLRHLKPSEFNGSREYHQWQIRQLKLLEAGLILYPSLPLDTSPSTNKIVKCFKDIIKSCNDKAIETSKNSESMKALVTCVESLSWRTTQDGSLRTEACHWVDGYPLNIHIYTTLLRSIFDLKDESLVLDEVDELLELMKKTWPILGISRSIHNLCFTWVLFHQYVVTGKVEPDLLSATLAMLNEVEVDAKRGVDIEPVYAKILPPVLRCITKYVEKRLLNYHGNFQRGTGGSLMERLLPVVLQSRKILEENALGVQDIGDDVEMALTGNIVDFYIRSSLKHAFSKLVEAGQLNETTLEVEEATEALIELAKGTESLALKEREVFSPVLKRWYQTATGAAAVTLHSCYGTLLKQYLSGVSFLANETIIVLQRAGKLENLLMEMAADDDDAVEYEGGGGKSVAREMVPYEVDSIILNLVKQWIQDRLKMGKDCLQRAKETETWSPSSKEEPYAHSALELIKLSKETEDDFLGIPLGICENIVLDLAEGLDNLFREYTTFIASCGRKQNYIPTLPPLTRCNRDSKFLRFWRKAALCTVGADNTKHLNGLRENQQQRPSTSRGTQRLYIRLNTLHHLLPEISALEKTLSLSPRIGPSLRKNRFTNRNSYFELARTGIEAAIQHVSEVAAYRLIFLDTNSILYDTVYIGNVVNSRIKSALRIIKQNLTLLSAILTDRALPLAMKDVMRASFEAFLMVLLAGGSSRVFLREDHEMIEEDFDSLKMAFCTNGEGLITEDVVEREAETVEGVLALMRQPTEQLVEDFSILACEASGMGIVGAGKTLPMPPTTGRWNRSDPNTILRVLCYRDDPAANSFLKNKFQLAKRR